MKPQIVAPLVAGLLTAGTAALLLPLMTGPQTPLMERLAAIVAVVFFGYLFFRSARNWETMLAQVRGKRGQ